MPKKVKLSADFYKGSSFLADKGKKSKRKAKCPHKIIQTKETFASKKKFFYLYERNATDTFAKLLKISKKLKKKHIASKYEEILMHKIHTIEKIMSEGMHKRDCWYTPQIAWSHAVQYIMSKRPKAKEITAVDLFFGEDFLQKTWCKNEDYYKIEYKNEGEKSDYSRTFVLKQYIEDYKNIIKYKHTLSAKYQLILSNPMYSQIEECFNDCLKLRKPFVLLVPVHVLQESWFKETFLKTNLISTLQPKQKYEFQKIGANRKRYTPNSCPFESIWIMYNLKQIRIECENEQTQDYIITNYSNELK